MCCLLAARFKLATLVQYVPLPVVGGYLGYVSTTFKHAVCLDLQCMNVTSQHSTVRDVLYCTACTDSRVRAVHSTIQYK